MAILKGNMYSTNNCLQQIDNIGHSKLIIKIRTASSKMKCGTLSNNVNQSCDMCNKGSSESIYHALLECEQNKVTRYELFNVSNMLHSTDECKLKYLLNFEDTSKKCHGKIIMYIHDVCNDRGIT